MDLPVRHESPLRLLLCTDGVGVGVGEYLFEELAVVRVSVRVTAGEIDAIAALAERLPVFGVKPGRQQRLQTGGEISPGRPRDRGL